MSRYFREKPSFRRHEERREPSLYVLDYLELGNPSDVHFEHRSQPFIQGIGTKYFTLLEATPLPAVRIDILEKIDLEFPSKIKRLIPITYDELTSVAKANLSEALKRIIMENEAFFVNFFNIAQPINIRLHALELLPDIGKKTMNQILEARMIRRFASFEDIRERVKIDPVKTLINRIIRELEGNEKYFIFIKPRRKDAIYLAYLEKLYGEAF